MARAQSRAVHAKSESSEPASATWIQWPWKMQALQVRAVHDALGAFNRYVAALAAARDAESVNAAQRAAIDDWTAWIDGVQRQWADLARTAPVEAWTALGWRPKPGVRASVDVPTDKASLDLLEQSKLGIEMLLRPWIGAPDLEHTDEFVA